MRKITLAAVMLLCVVLAGCQKESIADKDPKEDIIKILGDQTSEGERVIKMEMTADETQESSVCTLWADLENGMPVRVEKIITDDQGQKTVSEIQFVSGKEVEKIKFSES